MAVTFVFSLLANSQGWTAAQGSKHPDTDYLLSLSQPVMAAGKQVIIKYTSASKPYTDETDFLRAAEELSRAFQLPVPLTVGESMDPNRNASLGNPKHSPVQGLNPHQAVVQNTDLYTAKFTQAHSDNMMATLLFVGFADGSTLLSLNAETLQESGLPQLQALQLQWTAALQAEFGIQAQWNVMIQGPLAASMPDTQSLLAYLSATTPVDELARYQDSGSLSVSYHSSLLASEWNTGKEKMNLQVAVHRDSLTHEQRITIATPAISIPY
ncbi:YwmB family TATA-box binding protein [Paenibacillus agricola]|nr:YwmB family TATA-box binding protein [Paenibacillus agricola]